MKSVQGSNLFTVKSLAEGKPRLRPEIENKITELLNNLNDGEQLLVDDNGDPVRKLSA